MRGVFGPYLRLLRLLGREQPLTLAAFDALPLIGALFPAARALLLARLFTAGVAYVAGKEELGALLAVAAALGGLQLAESTFNMARKAAIDALQRRLVAALDRQLFAKIARMRLEAFERPGFYDRMHRAFTDVHSLRFVNDLQRLALLPHFALAIAGLAGVLGAFSPWLWVSLAVAALPAAALRLARGRQFWLMQWYQSPRQRLLAYYQEVLRGPAEAKEVRLFSLADFFLGRWRTLRDELDQERWAFECRNLLVQLFGSIATTEVAAFGVAVGAAMAGAISGDLAPGAFAASVWALRTFQENLRWLLINLAQAADATRYLNDLFAFLDDPDEEPPAGAGRPFPGPLRDGIRADRLCFTYPGASMPALQDVSFHLRPGERVALVGDNGAGKSTLVKLLLGFYRPTAGRLTYDGIDSGELDPATLREQASAVLQEFVRYQYTVRRNVGFGEIAALHDDARLAEAIRRGGAEEVVAALPGGLEARLGTEFPGGTELSGGQWQRLATARGFMREPQLLVLDEPTASLDPLQEAEVFRRFAAMARGRTVVMVSHRLGSCRMADRILVLSGGRLVEEGTHAELMARKGVYAAMFREQAAWYGEKDDV